MQRFDPARRDQNELAGLNAGPAIGGDDVRLDHHYHAGREVGRSSLIGTQFLYERPAREPDLLYARSGLKGKDLIVEDKFPIGKMMKFYDLADINLAAKESSAGLAIKPILRMPRG